jgi:hypothetical protein
VAPSTTIEILKKRANGWQLLSCSILVETFLYMMKRDSLLGDGQQSSEMAVKDYRQPFLVKITSLAFSLIIFLNLYHNLYFSVEK